MAKGVIKKQDLLSSFDANCTTICSTAVCFASLSSIQEIPCVMAQSYIRLATGKMFFYLLRGNQYKKAFIYWLSALDVNCHFACFFLEIMGERRHSPLKYKNENKIFQHIHQHDSKL
jgi:hypothetical protein